MSGCEWFLGATGEFCGAPVEAEGLILCAWHANCEDGNDSHRGPNQPTAQVSGWHPFMRQLGSNMCVCGAADSDPVHTSQAPEPTALDAGLCVWTLGDLPEGATTWPLCLAPTVEGDPFCPWHRQCAALDQFGDAHRGPNPPESQAPEP